MDGLISNCRFIKVSPKTFPVSYHDDQQLGTEQVLEKLNLLTPFLMTNFSNESGVVFEIF